MQAERLRSGRAQVDTASRKQPQQIGADIPDQRRLQLPGAKRIEPDDVQRFAPTGDRGVDLEHGTRETHARIACERDEQRLGEAVARPAHDDVRFADEPLRRLRELRQGGGVDQMDGGSQRYTECDRDDRHGEARGLLAQLRQQQHAPDPCRAGMASGVAGVTSRARHVSGARLD